MRWKSDGGTELSESKESAVRIKQPIGLRPICHWLDRRVKAHIFICYLSYLLMKTVEHMLKKGGLGGRLNVEIVHPLTDTKSNYGCAGDRVYKL